MRLAAAIMLVCALLGGVAGPTAAQARSHRGAAHGHGDHGQAGQKRISPGEAAREAQSRYGGRVLSVQLHGRGKNAYYSVKLLHRGTVRVVRVPARR